MDNEFNVDLITLISDEGEEIEFEILDIIENEEGKFYVLFPYYENPADAVNDPGEYYIMEVFEKDGEEDGYRTTGDVEGTFLVLVKLSCLS